jgi:hypothetical protein
MAKEAKERSGIIRGLNKGHVSSYASEAFANVSPEKIELTQGHFLR